MTSTLATEIPQVAATTKSALETWGKNERMRHIPQAQWIVDKLDRDLRRRIDIVCSSFEQLSSNEPQRVAAEHALTALCRSLERVAEVAKHGRANHQQNRGDITARVRDALQHAVTNLRTLDDTLFGRRYPFQTLERSNGEPLLGALLAAIQALHGVVNVLRPIDPSLDERLLDGLVTLQQPLRVEPMV